ncbi:hypothetical protein [Planctellipticum variicoloris]|uniref:hypothetical protein n=1 Tax=Planctellipticum variicoloris TaxID=3064265 RepID=UPI003013F769|nr:hypothetical protein SH412_002932 [Planctomycetaceae bacterium SH412]
MTPVTWILGQADRPEFALVLDWLSEQTKSARSIRWPDIASALAIDSGAIPDLVVVLQSHPDEYPTAEIARLLTRTPIARLVVVAGAWCEADGRRRDLWPAASRVPAVWAVQRLQAEWSLLNAGQGTPLPLTATRDECFAADHPQTDASLAGGTFAVVSPDRAWQETWCLLIQQAGGLVECDPVKAGILWLDGDPWVSGGQQQLMAYRETHPDLPIVVSLDFPLPELVEQVQAAGASTVVPKLAPEAFLLRELQRLVPAPV